ncbi:hypothetical protein H5J25_19930 (plasmid) [Sphingomonas aliaeris]|uniref:Large polyvalent protein-associated domain-containing protein n=1 Tax=Sphingomonas aliaeris TaxID=2759526 RepID=A0A974S6D8_9SPHN|nr:LPD7 domain-containing protein [Sphingomonas aliaeris]QQV79464.1 hypothetical protein H5J25_19930 [Sphingomonas aliaeris]
MSTENSVSRGQPEVEQQRPSAEFAIPPDIADRYEVRAVDAPDGQQRFGLFRPGQRDAPFIEITDGGKARRIVARAEDAETIQALVKIAQFNGWDRIDVDGSPDFRKAVWAAATRSGLEVNGYEPSFIEQEKSATARREDIARRDLTPATPAPDEMKRSPGTAVQAVAPLAEAAEKRWIPSEDVGLGDADSRLLLKISALTADRTALHDAMPGATDALVREVQHERIDENGSALGVALDRALASPAVVEAFGRAGYEPEALRELGRAEKWDTEVATAVSLARSGSRRDTLTRDTDAPQTAIATLVADRGPAEKPDRPAKSDDRLQPEQPGTVTDPDASSAVLRRRESDELAELFLHGTEGSAGTDPRLAGAMQAQRVMEQHIGEVFEGDAMSMASANLESRHMISDALRRGLDVSVREPTPVRQIEPIQTRPDLER